ncbi:glutamate--cysteine ligase, partial [Gammaproteobacteria bacterium]|nr:glutamate--cysteine ligase [Gammaproteobacteria bacterium]
MEKHIFLELKDLLRFSKVGFEKESLRVINSSISQHPHPELLGSALCNHYITTDFSEAQLELVTPPLNDKIKGLKFLEDIHHFVSCNIEDEILWPFSMPTVINKDKDIPIANYGSSNLGLFKRRYREGLSHRYSRKMQAISGIHYNYSVPETLWQSSLIKKNYENANEIRSSGYFNMLRNITRINWLILYLFGASPIITRSFITKDSQLLKKLDSQTFYLLHATSLRMSDFGYCNNRRNNLKVSMHSLPGYISDLRKATNTYCNEFAVMDKSSTKVQQQLNENILQIDDEYYAVARAKSKTISDQRTTLKLSEGGVDYIELRSLDLNPYSRIGIDKETVLFLETLLIYCFIKQGDNFTDDEIKSINYNDSLVAKKGREPHLYLSKNGEKTSLKDWGKNILDNLLPIAAVLDCDQMPYTNSIELMRKKINDPNQTLSGRFLDEILSRNLSFIDYGNILGES